MSASPKHYVPPDAAAQELWRVAEAGDVDQLGRLFMRGAHVNARNRHGMTALMKAAFYGHAEMVRALLERGADPNLARNDKFTALALAAFFGHVETVKILIEHGARTDVVTRCGASAKTWATRRTFVEAAYFIDSHAPAPAPVTVSAPIPFPAPVPVSAPAPVFEPDPLPVVKTLKDPPEIWDLVHEAPRTFNARSAFVARLGSLKAGLTLALAAVLIVSAVVVAGRWVLKRSQVRSLSTEVAPKQTVVASEVTAPANVSTTQSETPAGPQTVAATELSNHSEPSISNDKPSRRASTRQNRSRTREEQPVATVESKQVVATAPVVPKPEPRNNPPKSNNSLSPQLITPAKSVPPKGKVIQWP